MAHIYTVVGSGVNVWSIYVLIFTTNTRTRSYSKLSNLWRNVLDFYDRYRNCLHKVTHNPQTHVQFRVVLEMDECFLLFPFRFVLFWSHCRWLIFGLPHDMNENRMLWVHFRVKMTVERLVCILCIFGLFNIILAWLRVRRELEFGFHIVVGWFGGCTITLQLCGDGGAGS